MYRSNTEIVFAKNKILKEIRYVDFTNLSEILLSLGVEDEFNLFSETFLSKYLYYFLLIITCK